ncbi:hypothetical protein NPIL_280251 [Nephila pilipes]|uniref:Uncharacterized protein n=1 Tax=Nephila pilipes TaxID=299642 RepID=A0A8X6R1M3_NEPPI|nr:hypothetical protein NPIL_280251 [Nephila pilipes]
MIEMKRFVEQVVSKVRKETNGTEERITVTNSKVIKTIRPFSNELRAHLHFQLLSTIKEKDWEISQNRQKLNAFRQCCPFMRLVVF